MTDCRTIGLVDNNRLLVELSEDVTTDFGPSTNLSEIGFRCQPHDDTNLFPPPGHFGENLVFVHPLLVLNGKVE